MGRIKRGLNILRLIVLKESFAKGAMWPMI